jgi:hypothetical protein
MARSWSAVLRRLNADAVGRAAPPGALVLLGARVAATRVKGRGLRWIGALLLVPIPWAERTGALPIFTVLAPSEREAARRRRRDNPLTTWARQMIRPLHRWAIARPLVVVGDRTSAAVELLDAVRPVATVGARRRLDARLFAPPPPRAPHAKGRPRLGGARWPNRSCQRDDPSTPWSELRIPRWYGARDRPIEMLSQTARRYSTAFPPVPSRSRAHPCPARGLPDAGAPRHGSSRHTAPGHLLVRPPLATRGRRSCGARPPGRRDAAAVVAAGDPAHDSGAVGPRLARDAARPRADVARQEQHSPARLVYQSPAHLRRCSGPRTAASRGAAHVSDRSPRHRARETTTAAP